MVETAKIQQLMEELGPASDDVAGVAQSAENFWAVDYDEAGVVTLELDAEGGKLLLSTDLGQPDDERRLEVYTACLTFNYLWSETGGVAMALADGELIQMYALDATDLSLSKLRTVLGNFLDKARVFKAFIAGTGAVPAAGSPEFEMMRI